MKGLGKMKKKDIKELQKQMPELPEHEYKYHCICDNCDCGWYDDEGETIQNHCPKCMSGELHAYDKDSDNY